MKVVIIGASGHAKVVLDILRQNKKYEKYEIVGFLDDDKNLHNKKIDNIPVLGNISLLPDLFKKGIKSCVIALGENKLRKNIFKKAKKIGFDLINTIHPNAIISKSASIGEGIVVVAGAIINPDAKIGNNVLINTGAAIDHDCILKDNVNISPGTNIASTVTIGKDSLIGIGASVIEGLTIGNNTTIGAGAVVTKDMPDNVVAVGIPAKIIKHKKENKEDKEQKNKKQGRKEE